jgi:hypothetical protein
MPAPADLEPTVEYDVIFRATWSAATHPRDFPAGAHWSASSAGCMSRSFILGSRRDCHSGIQDLAELGSKARCSTSERCHRRGHGQSHALRQQPQRRNCRVAMRLVVDRTQPLVTLAAMIAPARIGLWRARSALIEQAPGFAEVCESLPYDAGTDSGATFRSPISSPTAASSAASSRGHWRCVAGTADGHVYLHPRPTGADGGGPRSP